MSPPKHAVVRFYFDADLLGLGKLLSPQRADFTYPGDSGGLIKKQVRPPCQVANPATKDLDWIPVVARAGWVIVTRDRRIQDRPAEPCAGSGPCGQAERCLGRQPGAFPCCFVVG